jgi:hypothetical protein
MEKTVNFQVQVSPKTYDKLCAVAKKHKVDWDKVLDKLASNELKSKTK